MAEIKAFIESSLDDTSGLLYVCGKPGQGKTAVVISILDEIEASNDDSGLLVLRYNAMAFTDLQKFLVRIKTDFAAEVNGRQSRYKGKNDQIELRIESTCE